MKTENGLIKITVIISVLLSILVGRVKSSENREENKLFKVNSIESRSVTSFAIVSESEELALENYTKEGRSYVFIKNILTNKDDNTDCKLNPEDVLVLEDKNELVNLSNLLFEHIYKEVEENGIKKKKNMFKKDMMKKKMMRMLIVSGKPKNINTSQIEEAKNRLANSEKSKEIKLAIELLKRIVNRMLCQLCIDNVTSGSDYKTPKIKYMLEDKNITNPIAYELSNKEIEIKGQSECIELVKCFNSKVKNINELLDKNKLYIRITEDNQQETKNSFDDDTKIIIAQIIDSKQNYKGKIVNKLKNEFIKNIVMIINILSNESIEYDNSINKEKLKKEIEKEEIEKEKDMLFELIDRCKSSSNGKISINELINKINNSKNSSYAIEQEEMNSESTEVEMKVNKIFSRMIDNNSLIMKIDFDKINNEPKPWNRDLMGLLWNDIAKKYDKFGEEGTAEELIAEITADNAKIASMLLNSREHNYKEYMNIFIIWKTIKNKLKDILEKKQDVNDSQITAEEKEHIIDILESISNESDSVTWEEQINREILEYISLGKDNSEDIQRIAKILHKIARRESISEEQDIQEENTRNIRTILSEIAEEYIKEEDYKVTDKQIQMKKQEIVSIVVKKFPIITEDSGLIKVKEDLTKIVENIVDILIDGTVDHTQYKGLKSVKEEIKKEEEYIRKQKDLKNTFEIIFDFIKKYGLLSDRGIDLKTDHGLYDPDGYIDQIKNSISSVDEETAQYILSDISRDKVYNFLSLLWVSTKIDTSIDIFTTYNEIWLNPTVLYYYIKSKDVSHDYTQAHIKYGSIIDNKVIQLTNDNLKAFKKARTIQDIRDIGITS